MSKEEIFKVALEIWTRLLKTLKDAKEQGKTLDDVIFALENLIKGLTKERI